MEVVIAVIAVVFIVGLVLALATVKAVTGSSKISSKLESLVTKDTKR